MNLKNIIFDFDGVIVDSFQFHLDNYNSIDNFNLSAKDLRDAHNGNFHSGGSERLINESILEIYDKKLVGWFNKSNLIHKETREFLEKNLNYKYFVITSGPENTTNFLLTKEGVREKFIDVLGKETDTSKVKKFNILFDKHGLDIDESIFITDTLGDLMEAEKVGIRSIALTFGFHDRETISEGKADYICDNWQQIQEAIKSLED